MFIGIKLEILHAYYLWAVLSHFCEAKSAETPPKTMAKIYIASIPQRKRKDANSLVTFQNRT